MPPQCYREINIGLTRAKPCLSGTPSANSLYVPRGAGQPAEIEKRLQMQLAENPLNLIRVMPAKGRKYAKAEL